MVKEFLEELTSLTKKYGIVVEGCGCCGSPFLYKKEGIEDSEHYVIYEESLTELFWSKDGSRI